MPIIYQTEFISLKQITLEVSEQKSEQKKLNIIYKEKTSSLGGFFCIVTLVKFCLIILIKTRVFNIFNYSNNWLFCVRLLIKLLYYY